MKLYRRKPISDLVMIGNNLNNIITYSNDQTIINNQLQDRIKNFTIISNMLASTIPKDNHFSNDIALSLQNQSRLRKKREFKICKLMAQN